MISLKNKLGRIGKKIYTYVFFSILFFVIVISLTGIIFGYFLSKKETETYQFQLVEALSKEISKELKDIENVLIVTASSKEVLEKGDLTQLNFSLMKILKNYHSVLDISAINAKGEEVVLASRFRTSYQKKNYGNEQFFFRSMEGEIYYSEISHKYDTKPFIRISVPLSLYGDKIIGVLSANVGLHNIQRAISRTKIGEKGYVYLIDRNGVIIVHTFLSLPLKRSNISNLSNPSIFYNIYQNPDKIHHFDYQDFDGSRVFTSAAIVRNPGWLIGVSQYSGEVFSREWTSFLLTLIAIIIAALVSGISTYRISRRLSTPIIALHKAAENIGAGRFDTLLEIRTNDEIEDLGEKFNYMTKSLKELYDNLEHKVEEKTKELSFLYSLTSLLSKSLITEDIISEAGRELIEKLNITGYIVFMMQTGTDKMPETPHSSNISDESAKTLYSLVKIVYPQKRISKDDIRIFNIYISGNEEFFKPFINDDIKSIGIFPIIYIDKVLGIFILFSKTNDFFNSENISMLTTCILQTSIALTNAQHYERTRKLSLLDPLTELANRRSFSLRIENEFQRHKRYGRGLSVVMLDIDHFKAVNDTYGHLAGDIILKQLAGIVKSFIRESDFAARYGGEEFIILLPEISEDQAGFFAERLRIIVQNHAFKINIPPYELKITVSLGVCSVSSDVKNYRVLIKNADDALYKAKNAGRNIVVAFK